MPKIVNHDERRMDVVRAIVKVLGKSGLEGATVRNIAREGGFSSGVIAHYFANKDDMVRFAFEFVADRVFHRIDNRLKQATGVDRVRVILEEHIPIRKQDEEIAVSLAFWEMALHDREFRVLFQDKYRRWRDYLRLELRQLLPDLTPDKLDRRVDLAVAMADGLIVTFSLDSLSCRQIDCHAIFDDMLSILGLDVYCSPSKTGHIKLQELESQSRLN
ncbi:transcriptional regulator, TetR family [Thiothrix eikelboomii]|uniref:Transcriptional regulator, TetR family n=1 Tax=Thiothrix eikelboomii TaxID=92487 RepID=A0A1T4XLU4_9GAMM|nr:TetR family transcriptional regulator C-terminal domain-containing protein [Thiothrix eikelboomii]SKA90539.1 transcriptional regulator, TetR family [Thiothrix eikelboomii]